MDYEKKYKEAFERCRKEFNFNNLAYSHEEIRQRLESVFPELKESEDERMRKEIISYLRGCYGAGSEDYLISKRKQWIAWLEKQGEQNPIDKIKPKFKVGDWITDYTSTSQIVKIEDEEYIADDGDKVCFDVIHQYYHLWTIQDAKDGDVLVYEGEIFLLKTYTLWHKIVYHCCYDEKELHNHSIYESLKKEDFENIHPADQGQRDLLFSKMKEAGYEWDAEKKELKRVDKKAMSDKEKAHQIAWETSKHYDPLLSKESWCEMAAIDMASWKNEQKPTWSEDGESHIGRILSYLESFKAYNIPHIEPIKKEIDWLKSLKERMKGE